MKKILGIDIGYGATKVVAMTEDGTIEHLFKFTSMIGVTKKNEHINDKRIIDFKEYSYYVGDDAKNLPSENIVDITEYTNLEYYAPLFLYKALKEMPNFKPDIIVTGLSIAQITNSGYFKDSVSKFIVNNETFEFDPSMVFVLPQGAGSKVTVDTYGDNFPKKLEEFLGESTYVLVDIGFGTTDLALISDGKTSPNLFEGIEKSGVMKIAAKIASKVQELYGRKITLHEAKEIIDTGSYKLRGQTYSMTDYLKEVKASYLKELMELIEIKYGKILDKADFIFLTGGGSTIFKTSEDGFIRVPKTSHEYYNSLGFALFGKTKI